MPEKDPTNWTSAMWIFSSASAIAGGAANLYQKMKNSDRKFSCVEMAAELGLSWAIGLGVFMSAAAAGLDTGYCAGLAGVGGKMSTELLKLIEDVIRSKVKDRKNGR